MIAIVVDTCDPVGLGGFWAKLLGASIDERSATAEWVALEGVPGIGYLAFQRVPEPKVGKNRIHIDCLVEELEGSIERAVELGASRVGEIVEEATNRFHVMRDPEGNEFCFVMPHGEGGRS